MWLLKGVLSKFNVLESFPSALLQCASQDTGCITISIVHCKCTRNVILYRPLPTTNYSFCFIFISLYLQTQKYYAMQPNSLLPQIKESVLEIYVA